MFKGAKSTSPATVLASLDDETLVRQVQKDLQGQTAFAELYRRHITSVYRFLVVRVGTEEDAQDITSQTFMAALEAIPTFKGRAKFRTWLLGIARNKAADHLRRERSTLPLTDAEILAHPDPTPDETAYDTLRLESIITTMRVLSPDRAEALALHSFGGLPAREIAEIMQKNEPAVRMLIHRAIRDIQQRLNVNLPEHVS
jgi:RNA polymerase sigma-70 factor (ECF subfamily)